MSAARGERGVALAVVPLPRGFYERPADVVAPALLGMVLARREDDGTITGGVIVETEAYLGPEDLASHARGGRRTARNESMWRAPGTAYVYQVYGVHFCFNVSVLRAEHPAAVLVRAIEPAWGTDRMRARRGGAANLCGGPGRLCAALGIDRGFDGLDLTKGERVWMGTRVGDGVGGIRVVVGDLVGDAAGGATGGVTGGASARAAGGLRAGVSSAAVEEADIRCGPRIGVDSAGAWAARPLRWWVDLGGVGGRGLAAGGKRS